jgi:low temperature requirement protein LtrA
MDTFTAIVVFVLLPAIAMGVIYWISMHNRIHSRRDAEHDDQ